MKFSIGIEISEQYLKIVAVKLNQVVDVAVKPIYGLDNKKISEAIAAALKEMKVRPGSLVVSLPRNQVTIRNLHLPAQNKNELEQMLELHVGRIVPYRKDEIVFSYAALGYDEMNYAKVLLAIAHKDILKRQLNIVQASDFYIDRINLSSYGIWEWALATQKNEIRAEEIYLVLDVDANFTDFIIFSRAQLLFSRSIAMEVKEPVSEAQITKLVGEVRQSLVIFHNEEVNKRPAMIFLSGAYAICDLERALKAEFEIPVKCVAQPYPQNILSQKKRNIPDNVSLTAAAQLVLEESDKRISLTLPEIQIRKSLRERTSELAVLGVLSVYFLSILIVFFWGRFYNQQAYLNRLKEQNASINEKMGGLLGQYKKTDFIRSFLYYRKLPMAFIAQLQAITPAQIAVNVLTLEDSGKITLRGQGVQLSDVFRYVSAIEDSKYFANVSTKYTRTKKVKDKEIADFEISFESEIPIQRPKAVKAQE